MEQDPEERAWLTAREEDLWVFDKLILSRKLGYICGPVGVDVPCPGKYIVRPVTNILGLGLGASVEYLESNTDHLTPGYFWSEYFEGDHVSVDYEWGQQILAVQGFKSESTFTRWDRWIKIKNQFPFPDILESIKNQYQFVNCEYIGGKLIEVHFRQNPDWRFDQEEFIPVWQGQSTEAPSGYTYHEYPDIHGRIGAFVR